MEIGLTMKPEEWLKRLWNEIRFWVERETSVTLLFWLTILILLLIRNRFKI
jgi:hypothetical protein